MRDRGDRGLAPDRVDLDALARLRVEVRDRVLPGVLGEPDHPRVRQHRGEHELGDVALGQPHLAPDLAGEVRDPRPVVVEIALGGAHHLGEGLEQTGVERPAALGREVYGHGHRLG
jgi:hypothetical protein